MHAAQLPCGPVLAACAVRCLQCALSSVCSKRCVQCALCTVCAVSGQLTARRLGADEGGSGRRLESKCDLYCLKRGCGWAEGRCSSVFEEAGQRFNASCPTYCRPHDRALAAFVTSVAFCRSPVNTRVPFCMTTLPIPSPRTHPRSLTHARVRADAGMCTGAWVWWPGAGAARGGASPTKRFGVRLRASSPSVTGPLRLPTMITVPPLLPRHTRVTLASRALP
eukprot:2370239-Rhodomonas_salina.1